MNKDDKNLQACINACWECRHSCQQTLFNHCLKIGGKHVEIDHVKIMIDCIQLCQTVADYMTRNSQFSLTLCEPCVIVCEKCALSCDNIGGEEMQHCAETCRHCAKICRAYLNNE